MLTPVNPVKLFKTKLYLTQLKIGKLMSNTLLSGNGFNGIRLHKGYIHKVDKMIVAGDAVSKGSSVVVR